MNNRNLKYIISMIYQDIKKPEALIIGECNDKYYLKGIFTTCHEITEKEWDEILTMTKNPTIEKIVTEDITQHLGCQGETNLGYDEFWNKYFNGRPETEYCNK